MAPETALQTAIRTRLAGWSALTALVPASSILDRNERPAPDPSIIIGECQTRDDGAIMRSRITVFMDLHVWKKEKSTAGVKAIAGEIREAIRSGRLALEGGMQCVDCLVSTTRFLRDPDGLTSHGVVTIESIVEDLT